MEYVRTYMFVDVNPNTFLLMNAHMYVRKKKIRLQFRLSIVKYTKKFINIMVTVILPFQCYFTKFKSLQLGDDVNNRFSIIHICSLIKRLRYFVLLY